MGKPGRDMLYTVATPQEKYLAKNVIDTLVYRGGDPFANWVYTGLIALGFTLSGISWISAAALGGVAIASIAAVRGYRARGGK
jgi:AAA family ATP:ADP antiporter